MVNPGPSSAGGSGVSVFWRISTRSVPPYWGRVAPWRRRAAPSRSEKSLLFTAVHRDHVCLVAAVVDVVYHCEGRVAAQAPERCDRPRQFQGGGEWNGRPVYELEGAHGIGFPCLTRFGCQDL